jgi:CubicO group peptidase (beta-lactamase class C family)
MKFRLTIALLSLSALRLTAQNLGEEFNAISTEHDMMGGAVVVFCESGIIATHYVGMADLERNIPVSSETKFRIASISKTVTAIAFMQLVEQELIGLDDDISTVLGYSVQNPNQPGVAITPRMLLSHTSTIIDGPTYGDFLSATLNNSPIPSLSELLAPGGDYYSAAQFNSTTPGAYFNYSNANYVILGTLVEAVSGQRFDQYCKQHLFEPLGMDASFNVNDLTDLDELAVLYRKQGGVWTPQADDFQGVQPVWTNLAGYVPGTNGARFGPQGGLRCSAADLAALWLCVFNPGECATPLINENTLAQMTADEWTYSGNNGNNYFGLFRSWGLGIHRITSTPGGDVALPGSTSMFGHTGEAYGLVSDAYLDTTRQAGFVFITNGVGAGYDVNDLSAFYTVEQDVFQAIENHLQTTTCTQLSVPSRDGAASVLIYPNPVGDTLYLDALTHSGEAKALLSGTDGRLVMEINLASSVNGVDICHLPAGTYILRVGARAWRIVKKE